MIATITTPGNYQGLVDVALVREALNFEANSPSDEALAFRTEEAAQRIESLTRLVLAESTWLHEVCYQDFLEHGTLPDAIRLAGLYAVGQDPTVTVADDAGVVIGITSTVEGATGDSVLLRPTEGMFLDHGLPLSIEIVRGVSASELPGDLRAAIVTMVEQLNDGFNSVSENSIIRICSRYGYTG